MVEKQLSGVGGACAGLVPLEELDAELMLELLHLPRDRRLSHAERRSRAPEAQMISNCDETLEFAKIHAIAPRSLLDRVATALTCESRRFTAVNIAGDQSKGPSRQSASRTRSALSAEPPDSRPWRLWRRMLWDRRATRRRMCSIRASVTATISVRRPGNPHVSALARNVAGRVASPTWSSHG
jgi:hypothetical protein